MLPEYIDLFRWHYERCDLYATICDSHGWHPDRVETLQDLPYLPAQYFKYLDLATTEPTQWIESSGTSGTPSRIAVDRDTIKRQQRALAEVLIPIIGEERKPFVVIGVVDNPGIRGLLSLAKSWDTKWLQGPCVVVGFTVDIWHAFHILKTPSKRTKFIPNTPLLYIGGWKNQADNSQEFAQIAHKFNLKPVNLYGFTEQLGTVYPMYGCGYHHCPDFARLIIRDPATHEPVKRGMGQFLTNVPKSYPGFSVLTDDDIELVDCDCQPGQAFRVHGRVEGSEIRGCGNVTRV